MPSNYTLKQKRRRQNLIGDYTSKDWLRLCKGGKDVLANIQCLCFPCNQEKGDMVADYRQEFLERMRGTA